jgi:hypothetical protein
MIVFALTVLVFYLFFLPFPHQIPFLRVHVLPKYILKIASSCELSVGLRPFYTCSTKHLYSEPDLTTPLPRPVHVLDLPIFLDFLLRSDTSDFRRKRS